MYLPFKSSKRRIREAENARNNRWEIVKALSHGQINRRDLFKWGLFTSAGLLLCKNGLSPYAKTPLPRFRSASRGRRSEQPCPLRIA